MASNVSLSKQDVFEKVVSLCKRRGFVFQNSEIYGGMSAIYDYGPLGAELRKNIYDLWWRRMITEREDVVGIDGRIIMHPKVWEASGHVTGFAEALVEDKVTHKRYSGNKLAEDQLGLTIKDTDIESIDNLVREGKLRSPDGNPLTTAKKFNLLMPVGIGTVEGEKSIAYLKGESCQNIYLNFKPILESMHKSIPFGIAQIGRAFRNEITLGQFLFRQREFDQMDVQYFCHPKDSSKYYEEWKAIRWNWYIKDLGILEKNLKWKRHSDQERAFYAKDAWDITYNFSGMGWKEIEGLHDRGDYDLSQHQKFSGTDLTYFDQETKERYLPYIVESSAGLDRNFLALLFEAYFEDGERVVLKLKPNLAPYKIAVFPLVRNKEEITKKAREVFDGLRLKFHAAWDDRGNIGKRYYSQDEIGTPYCATIDYQTLEDGTVTIRDRDTALQERVKISEIEDFLKSKIQ